MLYHLCSLVVSLLWPNTRENQLEGRRGLTPVSTVWSSGRAWQGGSVHTMVTHKQRSRWYGLEAQPPRTPSHHLSDPLLISVSSSLPTVQQNTHEISKRKRDLLFLGYLNSEQICISLLCFVWSFLLLMLEVSTSAIYITFSFFLFGCSIVLQHRRRLCCWEIF